MIFFFSYFCSKHRLRVHVAVLINVLQLVPFYMYYKDACVAAFLSLKSLKVCLPYA